MKQIIIEGGHRLQGEIKVSGAKNSAVALIPASLLSDGIVTIDNVPNVADIDSLIDILKYLNVKVTREKQTITIDSRNLVNREIPQEISSKLRASYYFMPALLGKVGKVDMYFPGGCSIGARPIDQTLKALKALGAVISEENDCYHIYAEELIGGHVYLDMPSVGATVNTILAAVKAKGTTILENAAKEPEIVNIATFLNNMGAKITGAGTSKIKIIGVNYLSGCFSEVIPDRIEAGTYVIAGALMGDNLVINNIIPDHIDALLLKLKEMGVNFSTKMDSITISKTSNLKPVKIRTLGYPGFATDLQQPVTALLVHGNGISILEETLYENRFKNVEYLNKMGADITIDSTGRKITIKGPTELKGTEVMATDLRAGACMVLAGLSANGQTIINNAEHILRGYENIIEKLQNVGAKIELRELND